jgi:hypothetical protein
VELLGAQVDVLETEIRVADNEEVLSELSSGSIDVEEAVRRLRNEQSGRE